MDRDGIDSDIQDRARNLHEKGVFPEKTALVVALHETGLSTTEIARLVDIDPSTVSHQLTRAKRMVGEATWTLAHAPDL